MAEIDFSKKIEQFISATATDPSPLNVKQMDSRTGVAGKASRYNDKYKTKTYQYPSDLLSNTGVYGDNYVVFYINVPENTRLLREGKVTATEQDTTSLRGVVAGAGYSAANVGAAAAGAIAGAGVVGSVLGVQSLGAAGGLATGAVVAGTAGVAANAGVGTTKTIKNTPLRQQRRILESITLYVPNSLNVRYGMNYDVQDMLGMSALANFGEDIAKFKDRQGTLMNAIGGAGSALAAGVLNNTGQLGQFMSAASGLAGNPKKEQVFQNVDFRTFNFNYVFAPRNAAESEQVKQIIKTFKLHMHPEFKDDNGYLFLYPSEFDIYYYQGNEENMNLPRYTSCVLREMNVNYTPNNQFNTFGDGSPTQIEVNLVFSELAILTKDQIEDGF